MLSSITLARPQYSSSSVIATHELFSVLVEMSVEDSRPRSLYQTKDKANIMQGANDRAEHLAGTDKVRDVRAREPLDPDDGCLGVKWRKIVAMFFASEMNDTALRVNRAVSADARRRDAVEEIHAICDALQNIARLADAEKVARQLLRQFPHCGRKRASHIFFTERATDADAVEAERSDLASGFFT